MNQFQPDDMNNSISDNQDDQNIVLENLYLYSLYETGDTKIIGDQLIVSETIVKSIINRILDQGANLLMEKYLMTKLNQHVINSTQSLLDMPISTEFLFYDDTQINLEEEAEPVSYFVI